MRGDCIACDALFIFFLFKMLLCMYNSSTLPKKSITSIEIDKLLLNFLLLALRLQIIRAPDKRGY